MNQLFEVTAVVAAFLIFFPVFWASVVWLVSRLSGWSSLANEFGTDQHPTGEAFNWTSGKIRFFSNYGNCLVATVSDRGVHLATWRLFSFGHKPMFFPWSSIARLDQRRGLLGSISRLHLHTRNGTRSVTLMGRGLSEAIARRAPKDLR